MKSKLFKSFFLTLSLALSFSTIAFASESETQIVKEVDGVKATLTFNSEELVQGSNEFTITLMDTNGEALPITNLKVTADMDRSTEMDDMNKDEPMMIEIKEGITNVEYTGMVDFEDNGEWIMNATFDLDGQEKSVDFDFHVESVKSEGPSWLIIGGFSGVIVLIIVIAAINKKKSIKA